MRPPSSDAPRQGLANRLVTWGGRILMLLALGFLVWSVRRHWAGMSAWTPTPQTVGLIAGSAVAYGLAMLLIAESWHQIVSGVAGARPRRPITWPSFGVTQVAKYLPGNVLHYVGRHIWLQRAGVTHRAAITAGLWEAVSLASSALFCAAATLFVAPMPIERLGPSQVRLAALAVLVALVLGVLAVAAVRKAIRRTREFIPRPQALVLSPLALVAFFVAQGLVFSLMFGAVGAAAPPGVLAISSLAWLLGYLTPGAPGGLGMREAVIVALATPFVGSAEALIMAGLFRVVTTLGDLVCFALSSLVARAAPAATGSAS